MSAPNPNAARDPRRWWMLVVLCLSVLLVTVDNTIVNVALPTLSRELGASTSGLQWIVDAYTLVFASLLLLSGHLGDRFGRLRTLQLGLALFALTSFLASLASTTGELVAGRAAMGVAAAMIYPATLGLLTNVFTDARERATAIGVWAGVSGLAVAIGPVSGGVLLEHFAWNSVFLVNLPLAALALAAGWFVLGESRDEQAGGFDRLGALGSVAVVGTLVWTLIEAPGHGWTSATTITGFVAAVLLLAGFIAWEARHPHPLLDVRLFTNPRFSAASGAITAAFFALFGFIFLITQYFQAVEGWGALRAGLATLPFALVTGVLSPVAILLMKRWGTTVVVTAGLASMSAGFYLASTVTLESDYWGKVICSMVLMATGLALSTGPATDAIVGALPKEKAGVGSAVNDTTREVGGTLGVAVLGSVTSSFYASSIQDSLSGLGVDGETTAIAKESVMAGMQMVGQLPASVAGPAADAVRQGFLDGVQAGSLIAAGTAALAAVAVALLLPARHREEAPALVTV
ncbi:DHA2 family efflux MFS transporter permease subunit [Kineosporia rhizophila]|uniref:DHA2 family efflux MFS transporter permease subunit n=1 Tax=Kineosporia TaxID=49184 RepID=UPI001E5631D1|nr:MULTISPECIES: DHA2 family efflux MFS transporter permease subunit [Kineosporia]MCE0536621.1 DHA2 family efflux MFS transporter permease subunit [Kineosporia rhizophila]GLY13235.1 MFS transporter [Kineosporia sp. NBRC 101677]